MSEMSSPWTFSSSSKVGFLTRPFRTFAIVSLSITNDLKNHVAVSSDLFVQSRAQRSVQKSVQPVSLVFEVVPVLRPDEGIAKIDVLLPLLEPPANLAVVVLPRIER